MLNNDDPFVDAKRKKKAAPQPTAPAEITVEAVDAGIASTPGPVNPPTETLLTAEVGVHASGSSGSSSVQYSLGSGHKKKQSFQELITESLFTHKRGSPNTLTL